MFWKELDFGQFGNVVAMYGWFMPMVVLRLFLFMQGKMLGVDYCAKYCVMLS